MIRLYDGKLTWSERDVYAMVSILGADAAVERKAPYNPAILKLAAKKPTLRLARAARLTLDSEEQMREHVTLLKKMKDAPPQNKWERRAFKHQRSALQYFRSMFAVEAFLEHDQTGVGKTLISLLWSLFVIKSNRTLILTKNIIKEQWADAIREFIGPNQPITVVHGRIEDQIRQAATAQGWVIGHWESLVHAQLGYIQRPWDCIIADEAQFISNHRSQRGENILRLDAPYRMAMTAHPFSGDPSELFNILRFLYPKRYSSYWRFFHMHVKAAPKPFGGFEIKGARRPRLLQWEIAPFTIGRTKRSVYKSTPRLINADPIMLDLTPKGRKEYERLRKAIFAELDGLDGQTKVLPIINDLSRVTRMRQYLIDPALVGASEPSVKFAAMVELYDQISAPTVVFSQFRKALANLSTFMHKHSKKMAIATIHGGMSHKKVRALQKDFLAGNIEMLNVVSQAGDTGLNLGGHGYVVHLDLPWTPREYEQRNGRVDRPAEGTGKLVPTTAYRTLIDNSYEGKMAKRLTERHKTFVKVFTVNALRGLFE
jgi:SNF2 family DNA or RNA helicase